MHTEELAGTPPTVAEGRQNLQRAAEQNVDFLINPVGGIDLRLLGIARECHVPHRPGPEGLGIYKDLFHKGAVFAKNLNAIIDPIAHINQAVV